MRDSYLVFGRPLLDEDAIGEVVDSMRSGWIGTGPKVARFEDMMRRYLGADHVVAVGSCTAALHLTMILAGVGPGDEVITCPMTFCATANAILHTGAAPVFVDCRPDTMNIDPDQIEAAVTPRTKAILPVHFAGRPCDVDAILAVSRRHGLAVYGDAAHCIEGEWRGRKVATLGQAACLSFYVTKNITTGEGGMIVTGDPDIAARAKVHALHGMSADAWRRFSDDGFRQYQVVAPGYKYNMTDMQAAIGLHQLPHIEDWLRRREDIWRRYDDALARLPLATPAPAEPGTRHARHLYTVLIDPDEVPGGRDAVQERLHRMNIGTGVHYYPVHMHAYYRERFGFRPDDFPNAARIGQRTLSLPLSPSLTDRDVQDVIDALAAACGQA